MKYKVGDFVRIQSYDWYKKNNIYGTVICGLLHFDSLRTKYCGNVMTIAFADSKGHYRMKEDDGLFLWNNDMIIGLAEDTMKSPVELLAELWRKVDKEKQGMDEKTKRMLKNWEHVFPCPSGYEFRDENGNVINATKIVLEKKEDKIMNENNTKVDMGEVSDGYHTFNELYEYRLLYNAGMFSTWAELGLYDVHKSKRHSDGEIPFGDANWFIVMAELPTGQISNHYEMKDWDLFQIPEKEKANAWDGHTPKDVAERLRKFLTPKPKYPTTYEECAEILAELTSSDCNPKGCMGYMSVQLTALQKLLYCRAVIEKAVDNWLEKEKDD